ncbi:MAG: sensor histidine kinase N-terminal domain-containing protein [Xanthomonadaceae bacterium]|nr:sensor histidine kinase N-terminal domain-containing protein [Xanthomonadaceae bacterium]MDE2053504.1 sensor histidine kinase N-terminal domain-containing protein [Xanthomonadaceae bacterium]MDE2224388.1 sensor histidine kinase N-terminal domain-containing protein [Xanthomonadaceae bacterium]
MIRNPSLRRRLLLFVSIPLLAVLVCGGIINYVIGLHYANKVYDRWLLDSAQAIGDLVNSDAGRNELSDQARILLQFSVKERNEFAVRSLRYGVLAGNDDLPQPSPKTSHGSPVFTNFLDRGLPMRMASVFLTNKADPGDVLVISTAETINKRRALARELLVSTVPIELLLIGVAMALVWLGINRGLRVLDPLAHEIRMREAGDLSPLRTIDAPLEVQPLVATIDALLGRLDRMLRQQQRFIADAAHQLRTPLAGLRLQAERALADPRPETVREALAHVERLSAGTARAAGQLLALARAQAPDESLGAAAPLDLAKLVREEVAARVPGALAKGIDLGYRGPEHDISVIGDAVLLRELLGNLIDNASRYGARSGAVITVELQPSANGGCTMAVQDNGPGVAPELIPRLGERFFRAVGNGHEGTGLGLAIVREIAERHGAELSIGNHNDPHGLRVEIRFLPLTSV